MNIAIIGAGWVGVTTGAVLAFLGNKVKGYDVNSKLISRLIEGNLSFYEPHLPELVREQLQADRLQFTSELRTALSNADVVFIAVGTPVAADGQTVDMRFVGDAAYNVGLNLQPGRFQVIVTKSTVPVGTNGWIESYIEQGLEEQGLSGRVDYAVASNPEFLREGMAIADTLYPDRIIAGSGDERALKALAELYRPIVDQTFEPPSFSPRPPGFKRAPLVRVDPATAELIKYAANSFLATKIAFINEMANICDLVGANVKDVALGIGLDHRIGGAFLNAGVGWGGSCFSKDLVALVREAEVYAYTPQLLKAVLEQNRWQRLVAVRKLQDVLKTLRGRRIGILGLAFKPETDDLRSAPALDIIRRLNELGCVVRAYDPVAVPRCRETHPDMPVTYGESVMEIADGADALILVTEWQDFVNADWQAIKSLMRTPVVIDGRNALDKQRLEGMGFVYRGVGI
ncbi:MAG: UDP-glucose/GDP-mannose dehydrogenase family protein [Bacillota bacterium]